ncbi:trypsin-like peptidase domain-containing protein [Microcoleus sp. FACHB-831]|uniref:S1C family serine protease n=1 Tax=Microcoleus sp. FACHB-831 TaxID=2692827 RepID=UPI001689B584|nr:trypsin-like peptidase domain-containing protein [Microcoleus sp. FACHB-831]MBD1922631.1 trypsin-like peptidase domain-containing protein [Microcoleus sp. FACHB-831]
MSSSSNESNSTLLALSNNLADAVEQAGSAVVAINGRSRFSSSGIIWRPGVIVTSDSMLRHDEDLAVTLPDNRTVSALLAGRDPGTDVAVITLQDVDLPAARIGDTSSLKVGNIVLALGRSAESGVSASMGVVSVLGGAWRSQSGGQIDQLVRLDLTLYPGFPGGPLVDTYGNVVGMNTPGPRNIVLTIPTSTVNRTVDQLLSKGRIARGYIGVGMQPVMLPDSLKTSLNLSNNGAVIAIAIEQNGPADRAGLLMGDILVAMNRIPVSDTSDVLGMLGPETIGTTISVEIIRGGAIREVAIAVGERPSSTDEDEDTGRRGGRHRGRRGHRHRGR